MVMPRMSRSRRGSAAIEFGFWLPVLMLFLSGVIDYGSYMNTRVSVSRAAMEGCRAGAAIFEKEDIDAGSLMVPAAITRANQVLTDLGITCPSAGCIATASYCAMGAGESCGGPPFDALLVDVTLQFEAPVGLLPVPTEIHEQFLMAAENQRSEIGAAGGGGDDD